MRQNLRDQGRLLDTGDYPQLAPAIRAWTCARIFLIRAGTSTLAMTPDCPLTTGVRFWPKAALTHELGLSSLNDLKRTLAILVFNSPIGWGRRFEATPNEPPILFPILGQILSSLVHKDRCSIPIARSYCVRFLACVVHVCKA